MVIYIARHGQVDAHTDYPVQQTPLSPLGRIQATKLGRRLAAMSFDGPVYASPFLRCLETAQAVCEVSGLRFRPEPAMREIAMELNWIQGFQGLTAKQIARQFSCCEPQAHLPWPWWREAKESARDVATRVGVFLDHAMEQTTSDLLLIGHGASTMAACHHLTGQPAFHYNAALSAVQVNPTRAILLENDTDHLTRAQITNNAKPVDLDAVQHATR